MPARKASAAARGGQRHGQQDRRDGRPPRCDDDGGHPRGDRPDRARLEGPQDVVTARAEEQDDRHGRERPERRGLAPDDEVDDPGDDDVEREGDREVRPVRPDADRPDQRPVEHDQRRAEVLVVRPEDAVDRQVAQQQEGELVVVEGHVAAEPDEQQDRAERDQERRPAERRQSLADRAPQRRDERGARFGGRVHAGGSLRVRRTTSPCTCRLVCHDARRDRCIASPAGTSGSHPAAREIDRRRPGAAARPRRVRRARDPDRYRTADGGQRAAFGCSVHDPGRGPVVSRLGHHRGRPWRPARRAGRGVDPRGGVPGASAAPASPPPPTSSSATCGPSAGRSAMTDSRLPGSSIRAARPWSWGATRSRPVTWRR